MVINGDNMVMMTWKITILFKVNHRIKSEVNGVEAVLINANIFDYTLFFIDVFCPHLHTQYPRCVRYSHGILRGLISDLAWSFQRSCR